LESATERIRERLPRGHAWSKEDAKYVEETNRSTDDEIAKILDPAEFKIYLRQHSPEASELSFRLAKLNVTDAEYDELLAASRDYYGKYGFYTSKLGVDPKLLAAKLQDERTLSSQINSILGDDRYEQYVRENDPRFLSLRGFADQNFLGEDQKIRLYAFRRETEVAITATAELAQDQREQKISEIINQADQTLSGMLNSQMQTQYLESVGGRWLSNLRKNPSPSSITPGGSVYKFETK
jgi:hypothetical protein